MQEVNRLLEAVREANPNARILLATEFAVAFGSDGLFLPFRFAQTPNPRVTAWFPYDALLQKAEELGVDVLPLEDFYLYYAPGEAMYKEGTGLIAMDENDHPDFIKNMSAFTSVENVDTLSGFVGMSPFGMGLRNEQWAAYINAV